MGVWDGALVDVGVGAGVFVPVGDAVAEGVVVGVASAIVSPLHCVPVTPTDQSTGGDKIVCVVLLVRLTETVVDKEIVAVVTLVATVASEVILHPEPIKPSGFSFINQ